MPDAQTTYSGERGDDYTTTETYTEMVNGHAEKRTETVTHTRWIACQRPGLQLIFGM